ncbi:MAG: hypothetical protein HC892_20365 [Saprospiraceae bacterium]|nr:hypothetical protein [Saprospiraceae bacterium]
MYSEELKRHVLWYYKAEWKETSFMLIWGGVHVLVSMSLLFINRSDFWLGWSIAVLPLAAIQSYTGLRIFIFDNRKNRMLVALEQETKKVVEAEKIRVLNTQIRLKFYRLIGQFLFVVGLLLAVLGSVAELGIFLIGSGTGLLLQSFVLMVQDLFAELRAGTYLHELDLAE